MIRKLIDKGVTDGTYPGAVLLVAHRGDIVCYHAAGYRSIIPECLPMEKDTIFDLASLTKPLATTLAIMKLVDDYSIGLDQHLSELISTPSLKEKKALTPRFLLNHSSGFTDWKPFYTDLVNYSQNERKEILREWIIGEPLVYMPGESCLYSDLGFIVLEWVIEEAAGMSMDLFLERYFFNLLSLERTFLGTESSLLRFTRDIFAATEDCPWRKEVLQGKVHDENAFAVGGCSGHAGLFGVAEEVFIIVNLLREHFQGERADHFNPETVREFFRRQDMVDGCTWALGWDTPSPKDSSSGKYFSKNSVGHLGFTGTSLWMDLDQDVIVIFLTNRVHPTRDNVKIRAFRPLLHDVIMEGLGKVSA